ARVALVLFLAVLGSSAMLIKPERTEGLLWIGSLCGAAFAAQAILKNVSRRFRTTAQLIGAFGLTATAAAAYYVMTGQLGTTGLLLWLMNWFFAVDQVLFVQLRIHSARLGSWTEKWAKGRAFLGMQAVLVGLLFAMWQVKWIPGWSVLCFA